MNENRFRTLRAVVSVLAFGIGTILAKILLDSTLEYKAAYDSVIIGILTMSSVFLYDFVIKKVYPDFYHKMMLPQTDERGTYLSGRASTFTLKLLMWTGIIIMYSLRLNGKETILISGLGSVFIVIYFVSYKYYEKKL